MIKLRISIPEDRIDEFCKNHHIRKLSFFGSVLREDFSPNSDVDVLVEFEPGHTPGLAFFTMEAELSDILGRKVDLSTPNWINRYYRDRVQKEAVTQYVQALNTIRSRGCSHGKNCSPGKM